ncbi:membrane protein [Paenibacillus swuensis]|uniref:Membrane protein n=1 Tax=Paenibacillus swuensis TaxID=1178515 RepID=A0A172TDP6_9BACL|nr:membrane protein [Paenibacillus swuensis]
MAKDSLIKGTIILAVAALVARVLGIFQRVPLDYILGESGGASFALANNMYLVLLVVATAGIPSTVSKMVSERVAVGKHAEAQRIYQAALRFGIITGVIITVGLFFYAPFHARYISKLPEATAAIRALAPALFFFPVIAMMRGYFQGRQMMMAGGVSQIVEQILRVGTAVLFAFFLFNANYADPVVAAGASFGGVAGSLGALGVMLYYARKLKRMDIAENFASKQTDQGADKLPFKQIYKEIFKVSIPIVLVGLMVPLIYLIDGSIMIALTENQIGYGAAQAAVDIIGLKAQSLAGIPPILAIALSQSILPVIASAYAMRNSGEVARQSSQALRISLFTGVPVVIAMVVAARPINNLIFAEPTGIDYIALLTFGTLFQIIMMTSGSILTGLGKPRIPMRNVFIGIGVKLAGSFALAPFLDVYGILIATTLCFIVVTTLNLISLRALVDYNVLGGRWTGFLSTVVLAAAAGWGLERLTNAYVPGGKILHNLISCAVVGGAVLVAYAALLWLFRVVTAQEAANFPAPLRKLINRILRFAGKSLPAPTKQGQ